MTKLYVISADEHISSKKFFIAANYAYQALTYYELDCNPKSTSTIHIREACYEFENVYTTDGRDNTGVIEAGDLLEQTLKRGNRIPTLAHIQEGYQVFEIANQYGVVAATEEDALEVIRKVVPREEYFQIIWDIKDGRYFEHGTGNPYVYPVWPLYDEQILTIVGKDGESRTATAESFVVQKLNEGIYIGALLYVCSEDGVLYEGGLVRDY